MKRIRSDLYLPVNIGGIEFKNPFYVASGPTTKSVKQLKRIEETGWAAASIKLTIDPTPYINRVPRYAIFEDRKALCFTAEKRLDFEEGLKLIEDAKKELNELLLMANITYTGEKGTEGWINMAEKFEEVGADIIELNMCCPNMSYNIELSDCNDTSCNIQTGASLGQHEDAVSEIVREIKKVINIPLFVKLTPEGGKIAQVAKALYNAGADAVGGTSNRLGIPVIDLKNPHKAVYHLQEEISMSCYSGEWLKPLAQRDAFEIRKVNGPDVKIMQAGGIRNYKDAAEMVMCGADLLGICAETLISGYAFINEVISDLKNYMDEYGYTSLREMRDIIVPEVKSALDLTLYNGYADIKEERLAAPCKAACPHNVPAQAYIQMIANGDFKRAYDLIMSKNPFQSVCGWVCDHPCEQECTRGETGESIKIRELKRFAIEYGKKVGWKPEIRSGIKRNEKVAVIGSGPAGISCAYYLKTAGYDVTVFEKENYLGGMLRYGLPKFRMSHQILDEEIQMMKDIDVKFENGIEFGKDITIGSLKNDGYSSIFIGIGAQEGRELGIKGENAQGVIPAISFLKDVYDGKITKTGKRIIVLGGGFTAVDAARTAKRLGSEEVYIAYRRTKDEMPASIEEITEAEQEGIRVMYLVNPKEILVKDNKVSGIHMANQVLGEKDASDRRSPQEVDTADFMLSCDMVISATGQKPENEIINGLETGRAGMLKTNEKTCITSLEGVFAGGDVANVETVISAIADGKRAACSIDMYIAGEDAVLEYEKELPVVSRENVLRRTGYFKDEERLDLYTMNGKERAENFSTYLRTMTEDEAVMEAERCLNCGCGEGCAICENICSEFAIHLIEDDVWEINSDECVACGMCYNRCPNKNIEMIDTHELV